MIGVCARVAVVVKLSKRCVQARGVAREVWAPCAVE